MREFSTLPIPATERQTFQLALRDAADKITEEPFNGTFLEAAYRCEKYISEGSAVSVVLTHEAFSRLFTATAMTCTGSVLVVNKRSIRPRDPQSWAELDLKQHGFDDIGGLLIFANWDYHLDGMAHRYITHKSLPLLREYLLEFEAWFYPLKTAVPDWCDADVFTIHPFSRAVIYGERSPTASLPLDEVVRDGGAQ